MDKKYFFMLFLGLSFQTVMAGDINPQTLIVSGPYALTTGFTMEGNIDMNGYSIFNTNWVNKTNENVTGDSHLENVYIYDTLYMSGDSSLSEGILMNGQPLGFDSSTPFTPPFLIYDNTVYRGLTEALGSINHTFYLSSGGYVDFGNIPNGKSNAWIDSSGNINTYSDLCIDESCISAWSEVNLSTDLTGRIINGTNSDALLNDVNATSTLTFKDGGLIKYGNGAGQEDLYITAVSQIGPPNRIFFGNNYDNNNLYIQCATTGSYACILNAVGDSGFGVTNGNMVFSTFTANSGFSFNALSSGYFKFGNIAGGSNAIPEIQLDVSEIKYYNGTGPLSRNKAFNSTWTDGYYNFGAKYRPAYEIDSYGNVDFKQNITGNQIYGEMWGHDDAGKSFSFASSGVYYPQNITTNYTVNGFTFIPNSTLRALVDGKYLVNYQASGSGVANHNYHVATAVNGVPQYNTETHIRIATATVVASMSGTGHIDLKAGDNVTMVFEDSTGTGTATVYSINFNLMRIGD